MKLAVVGSRDFNNYEYMQEMLAFHSCKQIISGGARGADKLAQKYAAENNINFKEFLPNWDQFGKSAGPLRNKKIVEACDEVVAFVNDEITKGTQHTIDFAEIAGKPVYVYKYHEKKQDTDWIDTIGE